MVKLVFQYANKYNIVLIKNKSEVYRRDLLFNPLKNDNIVVIKILFEYAKKK